MKTIKPNLECGGGGAIDPNCISHKEKEDLRLLLKISPLDTEQKEKLIDWVNDDFQFYEIQKQSFAEEKAQIESVTKQAWELLNAINRMSKSARDMFDAQTGIFLFKRDPPVEIPQTIKDAIAHASRVEGSSTLEFAWELVNLVKENGNYTTAQYPQLTKGLKPATEQAKGLVASLAWRINEMTGALPPVGKETWFSGFAKRVGELYGLDIGWRVVKEGISRIHQKDQ